MDYLVVKLVLVLLIASVVSCKLTEFVKWQTIGFRNVPNTGDLSFYNPYNNVPFGVAHYKNLLFVGIPRRNPGVPSTLNVLNLDGSNLYTNPLLDSYPSLSVNFLNRLYFPNPNQIISVYRPRVDRCDRLWFVDTGVLEYPNNQIVVQRPSVWAIDLKTNNLIGRHEIPLSVVENGKGLSSITIDDDDCTNSYAYIADNFNSILIVFNARENRSWRFNNNWFFFNPFEADYNIDGQQFQWTDGIFSVAIGGIQSNGFREAYFHPLGSFGEFSVSTEVLRNETLSKRTIHGNDFKYLGTRGPLSNSGTHFYDKSTNVLFFTEMQKNSMTCWNAKSPMMPSNIHNVHKDDTKLIYPADLNIDNESTIWLISNRLPRFIYSRLDTNIFNFHIWRENVNDALAGTQCLG